MAFPKAAARDAKSARRRNETREEKKDFAKLREVKVMRAERERRRSTREGNRDRVTSERAGGRREEGEKDRDRERRGLPTYRIKESTSE